MRFAGSRLLALGVLFLGVSILLCSPACHLFENLDRCSAPADCGRGAVCTSDRVCDRTGPIRIGVSVPLTGQYSPLGISTQATLQAAEKIINRAFSVLGRGIALDIRDDQSSEITAAKLAQSFVAEGHAAMIGPLSSQQALEAQKVTRPARLLEITPTAGASLLASSQPDNDRYFFQTITSIRRGSAATMATYAAEQNCQTMSIVYADNLTGQDYARSLVEGFSRQGRCALSPIAVPPEEDTDYDAAVASLIEQKPGCASIIASTTITCRFLETFQKQRAALPKPEADQLASVFFLGMLFQHNAQFVTDCQREGQNLALGFKGADVDATPSSSGYEQFKRVYAAQTKGDPNDDPPNLSGNVFDAVAVLALALESAGTPDDPVRLRDALFAVANRSEGDLTVGPEQLEEGLQRLKDRADVNYDGASGSIEFDPQGVVASRTVVWAVDAAPDGGAPVLDILDHEGEDLADTLYATDPTPACPE